MEKITKEVAQLEFDNWFESRKLPATRREGDSEDMVKEFVCAISEGYVVINNENNGVELLLREPLSTPQPLSKLTFKPRITAGELQSKTAYVKPNDAQGRQIATIAALCDEVGGTIRALGSVDYSIAAVISAFY